MNRYSDIDCSSETLTPVYGFLSEELVSIEEALEPIESQIANLSAYIKIAKKYCHYPSEHGLTHDESASIYIYTMEWGEQTLYRVLNKTLRNENRHLLKVWFPYLKLFNTALNKLPTVKENVWRGITTDIGKNFHENDTITWWSISSCSSKVNVIKNFLGNKKNSTMFLIEVLNGKKVSGYAQFANEDEIILRTGTEFRVKSNALDHPNGAYLVHLIEIDEGSNDNNHISTLASSIDQMQLTTNQMNSENQEFAAPGECKELDCKGRICAKCGKCRDWYYTGNSVTFNWIRRWKTWTDSEWADWYNGSFYQLFEKRTDGATCRRGGGTAYLIRFGTYFTSFFGPSFRDNFLAYAAPCLCLDNIRN
ncbi:unnamed protein product [Adineta steineri]|uniref:NAD(P)(+)--arginine ADP-ribosyltransferase n=1 Tax=Adineta steineri TaxID=433720 RepID=A0A814M9G1_9BILA|nr:unnamed protein product [Adineta steineri]CAF1076339.1 unnamed protein product [Adineta steineri]